MATPILIWSLILAAVVIVAMFNLSHSHRQGRSKARHRFLQIGKEHEEFWTPGDPVRNGDYDEFEDL